MNESKLRVYPRLSLKWSKTTVCTNGVGDSTPEAIDVAALVQTLKSLLLRNKVEVPAGKTGEGVSSGPTVILHPHPFPFVSFSSLRSFVHSFILALLRVQPFSTTGRLRANTHFSTEKTTDTYIHTCTYKTLYHTAVQYSSSAQESKCIDSRRQRAHRSRRE